MSLAPACWLSFIPLGNAYFMGLFQEICKILHHLSLQGKHFVAEVTNPNKAPEIHEVDEIRLGTFLDSLQNL